MNSTRGDGGTRITFGKGAGIAGYAVARSAGLTAFRWLFGIVLAWLTVGRVLAADSVMPRPPELERDVQFWIRVYTEIDTNAGFLHDQYNLAVVYDTIHFAPNTSPRERERLVDRARDKYVAALRRIAAAKDTPLSEDDQRIKDMWGPEGGNPKRLLEATEDVRFQLGQADRFKEGLIRSGAWETHIAEVLANLGLPAELAVLPHVESSFNPAAYSKVGAAGLWQFMRSTGRRYMRIDSAVDDRMDPFRSTEAAAQLLAYNYRLLGTWPLALTAYNHGAAGMRRAKESLGTDDIAKIVRQYTSRSFGFASRNFYVSFLAALEVDRNPEKYFGALEKVSEAKFQEVVVPGFVNIRALERALNIDRQKLRDLNPALLRAVWDGRRHVPKAYHLRLPLDGPKWTTEMLAARLNPNEMYAGQPEPRRYRVHRGDTLQSVAQEYGVNVQSLAQLNHLRLASRLRVGRTITLPDEAPDTTPAAAAGAANITASASLPSGGAGTAVGLTGTTAPAAATTDMLNTYVVKRGDSASEIAAKFGLTEEQLLKLNGIRNRDYLFEGQQLTVKVPDADASATVASAVTNTPAAGALAVASSAIATPAIATPATTSSVFATPAVAGRAASNGAPGSAAVADPAARGPAVATPAVATPVIARTVVTPAVAGSAPVNGAHSTRPVSPPQSGAGATVATTTAAQPVAGGAVSPEVAQRESAEDAAAVATRAKSPGGEQPVSAAQAEALSPAIGPAAETQQSADPTDYSVGKDDTVAVAAAETLGHYADWLGVTAGHLRQLNRMNYGRPVLMGHRIHLDFRKVSREEFEKRRREYHQTLQADYFASHRIVGTEIYIARRGDSMWTVTQKSSQLPVWLLQQYNPDLDFADLRPGTQIVMPRVEAVVASGG